MCELIYASLGMPVPFRGATAGCFAPAPASSASLRRCRTRVCRACRARTRRSRHGRREGRFGVPRMMCSVVFVGQSELPQIAKHEQMQLDTKFARVSFQE